MKLFWRCAHKTFSLLYVFAFWLSERMLDCQLFCSRRIGDCPF